MLKQQEGFTLFEVIVALSILSIMATLALPAVGTWRENASYRKAARELTSALRSARAQAISSNLEHRLEVDLDKRCFRLVHGNRAAGSSSSSWENNVVFNWTELPPGPLLRGTADCSKNAGMVNIHFNPQGSANRHYLCIMDSTGGKRFQLGVPYAATGRIVIRQWQPGLGHWK